MTRSTNMEHVEVLRHMKETIRAIMPSEVAALDAAIASLSAPQPPARMASIPESSPNGWLQAGGLLYRLTEGHRPQNRDEINVTMVHGSRDPAHCEARAAEILAMLQSQPPAEAQPCGCGEATCTVPWEPGCGLGKSEQHAVVESAPPSAPVGVEGLAQGVAEWVIASLGDLTDDYANMSTRDVVLALLDNREHAPALAQQPAAVDGACAAAAIRFALTDPEGMTFLRLWNEGEFDTLRREWPDAPSEVYVGADPLAAQHQEDAK